MKRTVGFTASLLALLLLAFSISANAETVTASLYLSPANENPPIAGLNATGAFVVTIVVNRDANGAVTGGTASFLGTVAFPGSVTITGLHIHEAGITANGGIVVESGINSANTVTFANGVGLIPTPAVPITNTAALLRLLKNPAGFVAVHGG